MTDAPKIALITTVFRPKSHTDVIVSRWLDPVPTDRSWGWDPQSSIVSMYVDQFPDNDLAREKSRTYNIPIFPTIREALTLGGEELAVDAVLVVGEHGEYPVNEIGQKMYPRKEFFDRIIEVFEQSGRSVPLFMDKHYSWNFDWAREMVEASKRLKFPMFAGSSSPWCELRPSLDLPAEPEFEEVVSLYYSPVESYGFHSLEEVQSVVENRKGGESGVKAVRAYKEDGFWDAFDRKEWSADLMSAVIDACGGEADLDRLREIYRDSETPPYALCVEYRDGLRAAHLKLDRAGKAFGLACRLKGEATPRPGKVMMGGKHDFFGHFAALNRQIEKLFVTGEPPVPVERTLLTTGLLAAYMQALSRPGETIETPHLRIEYNR